MRTNRSFQRGGEHIIPSARRGIHSHPGTVNLIEMVRFSDDSSGDEQTFHGSEDEVDNAMSKFYRTSSPFFARRRLSLTPPSQQYTDDSDDNVLPKSLPGKLPSHSHCSDDFGHASTSSIWQTPSNISPPSKKSPNTSSFDYSRSSASPNLNQSNRIEDTILSEGNIFKYLIVLVAAVFAAYYFNLMGDSQESKYDELRFRNDLTELGEKYKVDDDSVLQLQAGISTTFKREDTSCFIFVYNSMSKNFNSSNFDTFVNNVASNSAKFLRNESSSVEHFAIEASDLTMGSHSRLVTAYRGAMAAHGVLLVRGVERVPSRLAMAFHYYCDEFSPLVKKSAVFFTLDAAACRRPKRSFHASVEKCLKDKWNTVPEDNIGPLLTRVVSVVVDVTDGF